MKKYVSVQFKGTECSRNSPYEVRSAEKKSSFPEQKSCQHDYIVAVSCDQVLKLYEVGPCVTLSHDFCKCYQQD